MRQCWRPKFANTIQLAHITMRPLHRLNSREINWIKGALILLVVADHTDYFRIHHADLFRPLSFHVIGFFVLNFCGSYQIKSSFKHFLLERFIRYYWSFIIFYSMYAISNNLFNSTHHISWYQFVIGGVIGSFATTKEGCGGAFMWFLPSLFGFSVIVRAIAELTKIQTLFFFSACLFVYFFSSGFDENIKSYTPFGILVAMYVLPIVAIFFLIVENKTFKYNSICSTIFYFFSSFFSYFYLVKSNSYIEVGLLSGPACHDYFISLLNVVNVVTTMLLFYCLTKFFGRKCWIIEKIGENSLVIYLFHPLLLAIFNKIINNIHLPESLINQVADFLGLLAWLFASTFSLVISMLINHSTSLRQVIFPKGYNQLRDTFRITT